MTLSPGDFSNLVKQARSESPPESQKTLRDSGLVDLKEIIPDIVVDLKYAGTDNFIEYPVYESRTAVLQEPVAKALGSVQKDLSALGLGLIVYDAYRPWWVTQAFWIATPHELRAFLANPAVGSRHNRGCAVDLGLIELIHGNIQEMPSKFDEFTERAYVSYAGCSKRAAANRSLLIDAMFAHGFTVYSAEWWHFDHALWNEYPILNEPIPKSSLDDVD